MRTNTFLVYDEIGKLGDQQSQEPSKSPNLSLSAPYCLLNSNTAEAKGVGDEDDEDELLRCLNGSIKD